MISWHLWRFGNRWTRWFAICTGYPVTRFNQHFRFTGLHFFQTKFDKFIDIALVVGEQDKRLEIFRIGRAIVADTVQRIIDPFSGEERQCAIDIILKNLPAIDNFIIGLDQIGCVEMIGQRILAIPVQPASGIFNRKCQWNGGAGQADMDFRGKDAVDPLQLVKQITAIEFRLADCGAVTVDIGNSARCQIAGLGRLIGRDFNRNHRINALFAVAIR